MTGGTSGLSRATNGVSPLALRDWARVAVGAAIAATLVVSLFDLGIGEPLLDRAIEAETKAEVAQPLPEIFDRTEQRVGLVLARLLFACGVALVIAGVAALVGPWSSGPRRTWLALSGACLWSLVILPTLKYPALPPGVDVTSDMTARQLGYLGVIAAGALGTSAAVLTWCRLACRQPSYRLLAAVLACGVPALLVLSVAPDQTIATSGDEALLPFRAVAVGGQVLFWAVLAGVGLLIRPLRQVDQHVGAAPQLSRSS